MTLTWDCEVMVSKAARLAVYADTTRRTRKVQDKVKNRPHTVCGVNPPAPVNA
eukprot:CAMPEP_0175952484 /NCGR_PEP_ID=MMETSP0108-20121206/30779_1 /TAXON_ID=195067 ORGANISM="Goniomonas pacifica, Strain CCMP1869" /NCGR_SAMPLE_ID=MMETSP0108 /ASSEMBLY_ACC=CAM_ASM_000204 /LENGTH=52 /DNA_ID=CAMNT_0017278855 /DNA_START=735 /DNA_END=889 /DNA_ORIENTATION=-